MPAFSRLQNDILDMCETIVPSNSAFARNDKVFASMNMLRQKAGKPIIQRSEALARAANPNAPAAVYFTGDLSKNPASTTTKDGSIDTSKGSFNNGAWTFNAGTTLTFKYSQDPFSDAFAPVTLIVTGVPTPAEATIDLTVNKLNIFEGLSLTKCIGQEAGTYEFFVPAPAFRGGLNTFDFTVKDNSSFAITKIDVTSATDVGDKDATLKALRQLMARLGAENVLINQDWTNIIKVTTDYTELNSYTTRAQDLQKKFQELSKQMKETAVNIKTFSDSYINLFLPKLISNTESKDTKTKIIDLVRTNCATYIQQSDAFKASLASYRTTLETFVTDITKTASDADKAVQAELDKVNQDITVKQMELKKYQAQLTAAGVGLGASFFAGAVGAFAALAFLGPLGPIVAVGAVVVAVIGAAISIGFMIDAEIKINGITAELVDLNAKKDTILAKQARIKQMLTDVDSVNTSVKEVASYTQGFTDLWSYISNQLNFIQKAIEQWDGNVAQQPAYVDIFIGDFANSLKPYFNNISDIMEAYVTNFPDL